MDNNLPQNDSSGFAAGLMLGLIIGGAGGYLLNTDKGQELLDKLKAEFGDKLQGFTDNPDISKKLKDLEKTMLEAKAVVSQAANKVADATDDKSDSKKNFFQKHGLSLGK